MKKPSNHTNSYTSWESKMSGHLKGWTWKALIFKLMTESLYHKVNLKEWHYQNVLLLSQHSLISKYPWLKRMIKTFITCQRDLIDFND